MIEQLTRTIDVVLSDGNVYTMDKIGPNEWADFHSFCRQQEVGIKSADVFDFADTPIGSRWLVWRCMKRHTKGVSIEKAGELVGSIVEMQKILRQLVGSDLEGNPTTSEATG